jgi:AcrR family transcriptional regulator
MSGRAPYRKREEVREQILSAAADLFATRSPSDVTLREIAEHGGFQHSLVHRHFSTKDNLVDAVIQRTIAEYAAVVADAPDAAAGFVLGLDHMAEHPASFHAMLNALVAQDGARGAGGLSPGFEVHRRQLGDVESTEGVDPDVVVVALMAFTAGWAFLEQRWIDAGGIPEDRRVEARAQVAAMVRRILDREVGADG